jgi:hypothetical protein
VAGIRFDRFLEELLVPARCPKRTTRHNAAENIPADSIERPQGAMGMNRTFKAAVAALIFAGTQSTTQFCF